MDVNQAFSPSCRIWPICKETDRGQNTPEAPTNKYFFKTQNPWSKNQNLSQCSWPKNMLYKYEPRPFPNNQSNKANDQIDWYMHYTTTLSKYIYGNTIGTLFASEPQRRTIMWFPEKLTKWLLQLLPFIQNRTTIYILGGLPKQVMRILPLIKLS